MDKYDRAFARKLKMEDLDLLVLVNECIKEHKNIFSDHDQKWDKGDATEIWRHPDSSVSISYENGQCFHYWETSGQIIWDLK